MKIFKTNSKFSTSVLMLNLGGPTKMEEVTPFLTNLFSDTTIIRIPFGLGKYVALPRAKVKVSKQYSAIGGKSPLREWTEKQSELINSNLKSHNLSFHCGFRYGFPTCEESISKVLNENPEKIILFSQFPQFSCSTGGNIIRHCLRILEENDFPLSKVEVVDRWFNHPKYIEAHAKLILEDLQTHFGEEKEEALIQFTSHSIPFSFMAEGDNYPYEISATVNLIMERMGVRNAYRQSWQSKVGFQPWLGPSTMNTVEALGKQGFNKVLLVPIGFTSDHLETLYELDFEVVEHGKKSGIKQFVRSRSLNTEPLFIEALTDILKGSLEGKNCSKNLLLRCPSCKNGNECQILTKYSNMKFN